MRKRRQQGSAPKRDDRPVTLGDMLNKDLLDQLQGKKSELKAEESKKQEEEARKKAEERRLKEKNKSFEELLGESDLNWKEFK